MDAALVSAPFSRQMPPSIPSVKLAHWYGALKDTVHARVFDMNSDVFLALDFDDDAYNVLHHVFGGLVYIPLTYLPSTEFYFDTNTAVPLLLELAYTKDNESLDTIIHEKASDFGMDYDILYSWIQKSVDVIDTFSKKVFHYDVVFVDMPMPGASTSGLLLCKFIKDADPDCTIVAAGNHINIPELAELGFAMGAYDYVTFWDDEYTVEAFVSHMTKGTDINEVPNIAWKEENIKRSKKVILDKTLDKLPMPDFSPFDLSRYKIGALGARAILLETARSCPFRCNYCSYRKFWNCLGEVTEVYRSKSIGRVIEELEYVLDTHPVNCVSFGDRTLNFNGKGRFERLLSQLKGRNLIYAGAMRADLLDDTIIKKMAEAGFVSVVLGVESFDSSCIQSYEKGKSGYVENAVTVAVSLLEHGIMPHINILVGHPRESCEDTTRALEELKKVTDFIKSEGYPVSGLNSSVFHFNYPSKMYNEFLESNNFQVVYHKINTEVPEPVKKAAEKIPLKAVRKTDTEILDKCAVSDKIYTFWSDDEEIIAYTLKTLEKYAGSLFDTWMQENVLLVWVGSLELESAANESERIVKTIIDAKKVHLRQLMQMLGYADDSEESKKMLWAVIFMLYSKRAVNILPG